MYSRWPCSLEKLPHRNDARRSGGLAEAAGSQALAAPLPVAATVFATAGTVLGGRALGRALAFGAGSAIAPISPVRTAEAARMFFAPARRVARAMARWNSLIFRATAYSLRALYPNSIAKASLRRKEATGATGPAIGRGRRSPRNS